MSLFGLFDSMLVIVRVSYISFSSFRLPQLLYVEPELQRARQARFVQALVLGRINPCIGNFRNRLSRNRVVISVYQGEESRKLLHMVAYLRRVSFVFEGVKMLNPQALSISAATFQMPVMSHSLGFLVERATYAIYPTYIRSHVVELSQMESLWRQKCGPRYFVSGLSCVSQPCSDKLQQVFL